MIPGGSDIVIKARPGTPVGDLILGRVRRLWPRGLYQDADQDEVHGLDDPLVAVRGGRSLDFFVYRDRASFDSWERDGGTPENLETMLQFVVSPSGEHLASVIEVTLACGERTEMIRALVDDLGRSFRFGPSLSPSHAA